MNDDEIRQLVRAELAAGLAEFRSTFRPAAVSDVDDLRTHILARLDQQAAEIADLRSESRGDIGDLRGDVAALDVKVDSITEMIASQTATANAVLHTVTRHDSALDEHGRLLRAIADRLDVPPASD